MQAVKAHYKQGKIQLLAPITGVDEAELFIVVLDNETKNEIPADLFSARTKTSEQEFQELGLSSFFDTEDDSSVDWEDFFDVKSR